MIRKSEFTISESGKLICFSRASKRQSRGWERRAARARRWPHGLHTLASAYALRGDGEKAVALLSEAQRLDGRGNFSSIARVRQPLPGSRGGRGKFLELMEATYLAGLRKAGMPEE